MAAQTVSILRLGASLCRVDLPCSLLGLLEPPAPADLKFSRAGQGWMALQACAPSQVDMFTRWLHSLGAADVTPGPPRQATMLRGRFHQLPPPLQQTLTSCRVDHIGVSPTGIASLFLRADTADATRLVETLQGTPPDLPMPILTHRQAELLQYCVASGYYSIPRRASLRVLSAELGISTTSLSLALRRAEAKIVLAYVSRFPFPMTAAVAAAVARSESLAPPALALAEAPVPARRPVARPADRPVA